MLRRVPSCPPPRRSRRAFVRHALGLVAGALTTGACRVSSHPTLPYQPPSAPRSVASWDDVLAAPVDVDVQMVVSARWDASRRGLIDLSHPAAREAGLERGRMPIVLSVGVVQHPERGDFLVDTGVSTEVAVRSRGKAVRGLLRRGLRDMETVETLADIVARLDLHVAGVLLTHTHIDHVLGLPDLPPETPIYTGPGELGDRRKLNGLLRPTLRRLLEDREPVRELDPATAIALDPFPAVVDLLGDGSIWGIPSEGHTAGSMAWLVNATDGPRLFVGDTSHTRWGWEHGVPPGRFTSDSELNARSLDRLRTFVQQHPETVVYVGHEI